MIGAITADIYGDTSYRLPPALTNNSYNSMSYFIGGIVNFCLIEQGHASFHR